MVIRSSTSGSTLAIPEDVVARVAAAFAGGEAAAESGVASLRLVIVEAGGALCAMPASLVREVVRFAGATRLPGAPPTVRGLISRRGVVVTVLDLARCMSLSAEGAGGARGSVVLVQHGDRTAGLLVDRVLQVLEETAPGPSTGGAATVMPDSPGLQLDLSDGRIVYWVDVERVITHALLSEGRL
jgi:purine-binding chemotaxis protein CheW